MKPADYMIECERLAYEATGNPMHVWNAYSTARAKQIEVPDWVFHYLDKASWGIREIVTEDVARKDLAPRVARALDLVSDGRGTPFDYDSKWWDYGRKVRELMTGEDPYPRHHARFEAAKFFGVSVSTIIRGAKIYDKVFPDGDDDLFIDEGTVWIAGNGDKKTGEPEA